MDSRLRVRHPREILHAERAHKKNNHRLNYANGVLIEWITNHFLASVILFDVAFIVPLLVISAPSQVKITLGVISGSWIQWWALPALQRSQNRQQAQADAKADADHEALSNLLSLQVKQMEELAGLKEELSKLKPN